MNNCGMCTPGIAFEYAVPAYPGTLELSMRIVNINDVLQLQTSVYDLRNKRALFYDTHLPANYCFECGRRLEVNL